MRSRRAVAAGIAMMTVFAVLAWPWIALHVSLRGVLAQTNAHINPGYAVKVRDLANLAAGVGCVLLLLREGFRETDRRCVRSCVALGLCLLVLCIPPVSGWLAGHTSSAMAERIPSLFPFGLVAVLVWSRLRAGFGEVRRAISVAVAAVLCLLTAAPAAWQSLRLQVYLLRTHDYDRHEYAGLQEIAGNAWRGKTVLSDPFTSFFVRGMTGARVLSVPPGHASPAVDYANRDALVRRALSEGPGSLQGIPVDEVVVEAERTASFAETSAEKIVETWQVSGWRVRNRTKRFTVLVPAAGVSDR